MATYWENSCSFGLRYVSWYKYLIVSLVFSHLGFWSGNLFLIAPFPDLCLLVPFHPLREPGTNSSPDAPLVKYYQFGVSPVNHSDSDSDCIHTSFFILLLNRAFSIHFRSVKHRPLVILKTNLISVHSAHSVDILLILHISCLTNEPIKSVTYVHLNL